MKQFSIRDIVSRSWDLAVKHWPIFVLFAFLTSLLSSMGISYDASTLTSLGNHPDPSFVVETLTESITVSPWLIVSVLLSIYLGYVVLNLYVNAYSLGKPYKAMADVFKVDVNQLAVFFAAEIVYGIIVGLATCLCILPGIYLGLRLWYVPLLTATQGASFSEAFRRSWAMTSGHFWDLLLMGITMILIAIIGLCACCVGIYFAEVIIQFMLVLSFFVLSPAPEDTQAADATDFEEVQ